MLKKRLTLSKAEYIVRRANEPPQYTIGVCREIYGTVYDKVGNVPIDNAEYKILYAATQQLIAQSREKVNRQAEDEICNLDELIEKEEKENHLNESDVPSELKNN